jgi:hypothetical protein
MTINRIKAIEALERAHAREQFKQMSDAEIMAFLAADLGLPVGTTFSEAQLAMIANHQG